MQLYNAGNMVMNTYVYPISSGYVMIDTGYEQNLKKAVQRLDRQGISMSDVRYVFLTHAHDDHAGFLNELLSKYTHIKVIANSKARPVLLKGQNPFNGGCSSIGALAFCQLMKLAGRGSHRFPAIEKRHLSRFIWLSPQDLAGAEATLQGKVLFTPGHTADSISLRIGDVVFCGDAAMNGFPSSRRVTIWVEDKAAFRRSWEVLLGEGPVRIYPAHGRPFASGDLEKYKNSLSQIRLYKLK